MYLNLFQADASKIGILHDQVRRLLRIFFKRFVKTSIIVANKDVNRDIIYYLDTGIAKVNYYKIIIHVGTNNVFSYKLSEGYGV